MVLAVSLLPRNTEACTGPDNGPQCNVKNSLFIRLYIQRVTILLSYATNERATCAATINRCNFTPVNEVGNAVSARSCLVGDLEA